MINYGFVKVAVASPKLRVADPDFNTKEIEKQIREADSKGTTLLVFPELCVTGYTCADLFAQKSLIDKSLDCLKKLLKNTESTSVVCFVGMPLVLEHRLYNCAFAIQQGGVLGIVPKMYLPNYKEFYEKRWFTPGKGISRKISEVKILGRVVPFGNLIFRCEDPDFSFGVEICEDLWVAVPPSSYQALNGATVIANLSASNELVSKSDYRRLLVLQQSARCV
ncbi:MAG: NAD(+) synthase, partial [Firmicutes bacterium]|nr:NAD(+) synthase [Bacillota bacterium]